VANGERDREALLEGAQAEIGRALQAKLDYAELRDPGSLEISPGRLAGPALLALAVHFDADPDGQGAPVRLIDNRVLLPEPGRA
jgi:pantothenate synthetase